MTARTSSADGQLPSSDVVAANGCIGHRYRVQALLGRGGMARVYRVHDTLADTVVALKWLDTRAGVEHAQRPRDLLEREYNTLKQLAHPRVVQAYDYGLHDEHPYYTMELLDGGDLRELAPLPWQEVCSLAYDICSVLSLLHSRRLLHLDITPRNIRRTADGKAKLIDFGLLSGMGPRTFVAGTPAYVAPETMGNLTLDGRADLFSLGATLYYALTGRAAYPAQHLYDLQDAWRTSPVAPSRLVQDLPPALDALVLSLVRIGAGSRPKSAAEVMEQLLPLMPQAPSELLSVRHAYLTTPQLIGRDEIVTRFRQQMVHSLRKGGGGFMITGQAGVGRTRVLDAFVLEAKLVGALSLRASGAEALGVRFGTAAHLTRQLFAALPDTALPLASRGETALLFDETRAGSSQPFTHTLSDITRPELDRAAVHRALCELFLHVTGHRTLAIAIDDLQLVDDASAAFIASLATDATTHPLVYAVTVDAGAREEGNDAAREVLRAQAELVELRALDAQQITSLLRSVFGDVTDLQLLSSRLYPLCGGRPRECMALAKQLVDDGVISYADGTWSLPASYAQGQLPASLEEAIDRQASQLSAEARRVAGLLGLGLLRRLGRSQLRLGTTGVRAELDAALDELLRAQLVTGDHAAYTLCHDGFARWINARMLDDERRALHQELVRIYQGTQPEPVLIAYHQLCSNTPEQGLRLLLDAAPDATSWETVLARALLQLSVDQVGETLQLALRQGERSGLTPRELLALRERIAHQSSMGEDCAYYYGVAAACLDQYKRDSGFYTWQALDASLCEQVRTERAMAAAFERFNAMPEAERVLSPLDAIKGLVRWVVISLPVAARIADLNLTGSLVELLEPFAKLSPLVNLIARNAEAARLLRCEGRVQEARELWIQVVRDLDTGTGIDVAYRTRIRTALHCTLGSIDALLGIPSTWAERAERGDYDPLQLAQVYSVRKLEALSEGDWEAAERHRRHAELIRLRNKAHHAISTLAAELAVHAAARDLTGVKQVRAGIQAMADKYPGWVPQKHLADAHYARLRGDLDEALRAADRAIDDSDARFGRWLPVPSARVTKVEVLIELDRLDDAIAQAEPLRLHYRASGVHHIARDLERALALAEAKRGGLAAAMTRIEAVVHEQLGLGIAGMQLGLSYDTAARIAILARDTATFERYSALTAEYFLRGGSSVLGALYESLQEAARAAGLTESSPFEPVQGVGNDAEASTSLTHRIANVLAACQSSAERARAVLDLLSEGRASQGGLLFLLSEQGLELAASSSSQLGSDDALLFARDFLSMELERIRAADAMTHTIATLVANDTTPAPSVWQAPDGTRYTALLVSGTWQGRQCVVGVALLRELSEPLTAFRALTAGVTERLLHEGDGKGARFVA